MSAIAGIILICLLFPKWTGKSAREWLTRFKQGFDETKW
jgi:hypothetical protein